MLEFGRVREAVRRGPDIEWPLTFGASQEKKQMDFSNALQELYAEKEKLEHSIALLEELQNSQVPGPSRVQAKSRRGRRTMGIEERRQVSARMRTYWANRRQEGR